MIAALCHYGNTLAGRHFGLSYEHIGQADQNKAFRKHALHYDKVSTRIARYNGATW